MNRRAAETRGRLAEWIAAFYLMAKGYRILGRRLRTNFGEIDLAAYKRGILVFVEVKARASLAAGLASVGPMQQRRIADAARALAARWRLLAAPMRFDVIVVGASLVPRHLRGAWSDPR